MKPQAEIMVIFEVMTDTQTHSKSTYRLGRMGRVKIGPLKFNILNVLQLYTIKIDKLSEMTKSAERCLRTGVWPEPKA